MSRYDDAFYRRPWIRGIRLMSGEGVQALYFLYYMENSALEQDCLGTDKEGRILLATSRQRAWNLFRHVHPSLKKFGPPRKKVNDIVDFSDWLHDLEKANYANIYFSDLGHVLLDMLETLGCSTKSPIWRAIAEISTRTLHEKTAVYLENNPKEAKNVTEALHACLVLLITRSRVI